MHKEPIAVIGIGCRLPGANNPQEFWKLLHDNVDAISEVPPSRWDLNAFYDPDPTQPHKMNTRWGGFLENVDRFDPTFFGITPREANTIDPQQRLILEVAWEALEDAGQVPQQLSGSKTGVFIGISSHDYSSLVTSDDPYALTGNVNCIAANRISYVFNFRGPSLAVDTACSSSLVAVHLACQSIWNQESTLALAGGVQVILSADLSVSFSKAGLMAPDGRCKPFDAKANGYVRSEGAGTVLLKPLSQAQKDGDRIYAVILGTAMNQDGRSNGLSAPNPEAQEAVVREAYARAGVSPGQVQYVEAHGTGTKLGDPMELKALGAVLAEGRAAGDRCVVGSVKANLGHSETAAGITGLIKVALALEHQQIPASLHFQDPNPYIDFDALQLRVQQTLEPWPYREGAAIAGINSFGFGGTNAHAVLQEAPSQTPAFKYASVNRPWHLLALTAKSEPALRELSSRYQTLLAQNPMLSLADVCHCANLRRSQFKHRLVAVGASSADVQAQLAAFAAGETEIAGLSEGQIVGKKAPRIAFLFSGQGSQYVGMGKALYESQPTFRRILDRCDEILRSELKLSLLSVLYPEAEGQSPIDDTAYTQPALFALEYALTQLWLSWGIAPAVVMGHSVGEYVAACIAGVFSLEDGLKLIAARGRLMQALPQNGAMVSVLAEEARVAAAVRQYEGSVADSGCVAIAAINGPQSIVISGEQTAIAAIVAALEAEGIKTKPLQVSHAFHSPLMEPMLAEFARVASEVAYARPRTSLISNLTGDLIGPEIATPEYWCLHVRQPVRFAASMETLQRQEYKIFLEIGPKPVLLGMGRTCLPEGDRLWLPSLRPGQLDWQQMLQSLGALYLHNAGVDWAGFDRDYVRQWVNLPTYPFQRQRYWWADEDLRAVSSNRSPALAPAGQQPLHPLLGVRLPLAGTSELRYQSQLSGRSPAYLQDHCVLQQPVLPASAYIEMAAAAALQVFQDSPWQIEDVTIEQPLLLHDKDPVALQLQLVPEGPSGYGFQIFSLPRELDSAQPASIRHAAGKIAFSPSSAQVEAPALDQVRADCPEEIAIAGYYRHLQDRGLHYGPSFQGVRQLWKGNRQALGWIQLPQERGAEAEGYTLHPALLDACFQVLGAADLDSQETFLPVSLGRLQVYSRDARDVLWCHVRLRSFEAKQVRADLDLFDAAGVRVAALEGFTLRSVNRRMLQRLLQQDVDLKQWLYEIVWQPSPRIEPPAEASLEGRSPKTWLIFADDRGVGAQLSHQLQAQGESCVLAFAGDRFERIDPHAYRIDPANPEDFRSLLQDFQTSDRMLSGVVHLWSLTEPTEHPRSAADLDAAQLRSCGSALHLVQALGQSSFAEFPRLWLVTQDAQAIGAASAPPQVQQSSLWGLGRTIALEYPNLHCTCLDLDSDLDRLSAVVADLRFPDGEDRIAYRQGERHVARLVRHETDRNGPLQRPDGSAAFQLKISSYGILENLMLAPSSRRAPGRGEVEIQVEAAGLNFRDVLNALGMLQAYLEQMGLSDAADVPFGGECAGRIAAIGEGVEGFEIGDSVIAANAIGSMANFVTVPAQCAIRTPEHLSAAEAATISTAFLTAYYGLHHLAKIQAGDRVLIHAAAGGVGQAAVQLAQRAGARVFATASPGKWDFLQSMGVEHTFNSRTLDFAAEILELTEGQGIDIVLNSLNGDFIPKNLEVLAPQGRFVEIGKLGIWEASEVRAQRPDVSYFPFDLLEVSLRDPALFASMLRDVMEAFERRQLQPLPHQVFPIEEAVSAFRHMAQAKHRGKVVLSVAEHPPTRAIAREDGTYLVTGGLGALGLQLTRWLVERGAKTLVLVGRSAPSEAARQAIARLEQTGARVRVFQADIAQPTAVAEMFAILQQSLPPLRGIIHAAGLLDDGILQGQTWERFERVMGPKVAGAWNLHAQSLDLSLDFFVCFSSVAALLGSPGQGNYAAANAFMDGLAHYRRKLGLPGLSLNWGPWGGAGMAAELSDRDAARLALSGITPLDPDLALEALEELLAQDAPQIGVVQVEWAKFLDQISNGAVPPFLENVAVAVETGAQSYSAFRLQLDAAPAEERLALLTQHVQSQIAKVIGLTPEEVELDRSFTDLGMDSLMGMEMKSRLQSSLNFSFPITLAMDYPTVGALIAYIDREVLSAGAVSSSPGQTQPKSTPQSPTATPLGSKNGSVPQSRPAAEAPLEALGNGHQPPATQANGSVANGSAANGSAANGSAQTQPAIPPEFYQFERSPEYLNLKEYLEQGKEIGNPFFTVHDGIANDTTSIEGQAVVNYSSYNYLGLSGDEAVSEASKAAIDRYGTSVSASRVVSGERSIHQDLERALADFLGTEDCIVYIGGHTTNVSTIGHLFGKNDLIVCDAFSHNSIQIGCALSGATTVSFAHNDVRSLEQILQTRRHGFEKVLIAVEGVYSTDGDLAPLPEIVELKKKYKTFLLVDEAHSIGAVGRQGRGVGEHFGVARADVELWMGTLSKSFASCGGYIGASKAMVEYLKYTSPGFVYSVGMTPSNAASALAALQRLQAEPDRVTRLQARTALFLSLAKAQGFDTGPSHDSPVVPIIVGDPYKAVALSHALLDRGINAQPMIYPSVPYDAARLRFFLSCDHTEAQIRQTISVLAEEIAKMKGGSKHDWLHYLIRSQFVTHRAARQTEPSVSS
ncbi:aminotransferase class I/II-fold pyridoxal phosphate-dependent enzyme [Altericista sp. CCNU0014]|uniref:aminotransferase class I/II-fold pyridoxal phosphate-dependent enzyme n=1 Tax=Altericista sp. CCNU0014 TaxID=3082949 RepID=UPI00384F0976